MSFPKWHETDAGQGLQVLFTLLEDSHAAPSSPEYIKSWIEQHGLTFEVVSDPEAQMFSYGGRPDGSYSIPTFMLIDVSTMDIMGYLNDLSHEQIEARIQENL